MDRTTEKSPDDVAASASAANYDEDDASSGFVRVVGEAAPEHLIERERGKERDFPSAVWV